MAARKHFRTNEDLVADLDEKTGAIQIFAVKKVVDRSTDPDKEMSLEEARAINPDAEDRLRRSAFPSPPTRWAASPRRPPSR